MPCRPSKGRLKETEVFVYAIGVVSGRMTMWLIRMLLTDITNSTVNKTPNGLTFNGRSNFETIWFPFSARKKSRAQAKH